MEALPNCILCNQSLQPVRTGPVVTPFWLRYTDFLRLPFSLPGLGLLLIFLLLPMFAPENLLLPAAFVSYALLALIGWGLLRRGASGEVSFPGLPELGQMFAGPAAPLALLLAGVMTGLVLMTQKAALLAFLAALVFVGALPALLMVVARDKSVASLRQKDSWISVFQGVRFLYLPLGGGAVVLFILAHAFFGLLSDVATPGVAQGMRNVFYGYGLWVVFAVSGYCLIQFQDALGFEGERGRNKVRKSAVRRIDTNTAKLEVYLKEGMYDKAVSHLRGLAEKQRNDIAIQERYFQLLVFLKDKSGVAHQGESFMAALIAGGKGEEAVQILTKVRLVMPEFRPEEPAVAFDLAKACVECREFARAAALLDGMHQTAPHFPQLPEAYMLRAKLLSDKLGQSAAALDVMEYLVTRFQKHPRYESMRGFWKQLGGKDVSDEFH
ncbi:tetratricopeptide repeat protein [Fluviicoccus keumensis]|nr:tetratricopeptide repeat protein [Fluviicoccus keumensis]